MTKNILTYGAIGGIIVVFFMLIGQSLMVGEDGEINFGLGETLGYISMIVALSVIFFGIRSYRDQHLSGSMTFGNAFKIGILITLVASVFYVVGWMIYYHTSDNAAHFMEQYVEYSVENMEAKGASQSEIAEFRDKTTEFAKMYENPLVMAGITLLEIFPVGLIITLLSSFLLKKQLEPKFA